MKNTKKILSITLTLCLMVAVLLPMTALPAQAVGEAWTGDTATAFAGGTGTEADPFQISTGAELAFLASSVNGGTDYEAKYFKLTGDINLNNRPWTPIGTSSNTFLGIFDGGNFEITGLYINSPDADNQGLFGYIGNGGYIGASGLLDTLVTVKNLKVTGDVTGKTNVGGVVGRSDLCSVTNCVYNGTVNATGSDVGGIVGFNRGIVANSYNTAEVSGNANVGGVVGSIPGYSRIENSYNTGAVSASDESAKVGGIAGLLDDESFVTNCYWLKDSANTGMGERSGYVNNVGSFESPTSAITNLTNANGDIPTANLLAALNAGVLAYSKESHAFTEAQFWLTKTDENGEYPVFTTYWSDYAEKPERNEGIYQISSAAELAWLIDNYESNTTYTLTKDIDLTGHMWEPIGIFQNFNGTFDGGGNSVSGLYIYTDESRQGLFGAVGGNGTVQNISVSGSITGPDYISGVVGQNYGEVKNSTSSAFLYGSGNTTKVGGLAGSNEIGGTVTNSCNTGDISVSGDNVNVGGVVGFNEGSITNSYNTGTVSTIGANSSTGGVVGYMLHTDGTVTNSYNTGTVSANGADSRIGSVAGRASMGTITNCYWLKDSANTGIGESDDDVSNVGSFESPNSEITNITNANSSIPTDNLLAALNAGVTGDSIRWTEKSGVNEGYPVHATPSMLGISFTLPSVTVKDKPTYGDTWGEIITFDGGSASVNGVDIPGTFSVVDADTVPDAGNNMIYSVVFNSSDTPQTYVDVPVTLADGTVTVAPKTLSVSGFEATDRVYDGTTAVTLTGGTLSGFENGDTVSDLTGFTMPERGLIATVDVGEGKAVSFADGAFVTTNGNYTITEPTDVTVDITKAYIVNITSPSDLTANPVPILANDSRNTNAETLRSYAGLPSKVQANYGSGLAELGLTWSVAPEPYNPKGGTYTYTGTLAVGSNFNTYTSVIQNIVTVNPVTLTAITNLPTGGTYSVAQINAMTDLSELGLTSAVTLDYDLIDNNTTFTPTWDSDLNDFKAAAALVTAEQYQTVTVTMTDDNFPEWATVTATMPTVSFTITEKMPVNVTVTVPTDVTYGDALADPTAQQTEIGSNGTEANPTWTYLYEGTTRGGVAYSNATKPTDAGTYTVTAILNSNIYVGSSTSEEFTIAPKALSDSMVGDIAAVTYNGNAHEPTPTVTDGDLLDRADYTVSYENNTDAGTAKVILTASATGNYIDSDPKASKEFTIEKASIAGLEPIISGTAEVGQVLSAGLADVANSELEWTWMVNAAPAGGPTAPIYTVNLSDSNSHITVVAKAIADGNYTGTSEVSKVVSVVKADIPGTSMLIVEETNVVGGTEGQIEAGDVIAVGGGDVIISLYGGAIKWYRNEVTDTPIHTGVSYTVTQDDAGATLIARFVPGDDYTGYWQEQVTVGTTLLKNDDFTVVSTGDITAPAVGDTLSVTSDLTSGTDYSLKWQRNTLSTASAETIGTGASYTLTKDDLGATITLVATGTGNYSGSVMAKVITVDATSPDAPSVTATAGNGQVTLSWTAFDGGSPIMGYIVQMGSDAPIELTPNITSYVFGNLENGTEYSFTVSATNSKGTSASGMASATPAVPVSTGGGGGGGVATPDNTVDSEDPLTSDDFKELAESGDSLTVNGDDEIEAEFDTAALDAILDKAEGKTVEFIAKEADPADVNDAQKVVVGDNLVLDLQVLVDGVEFTDFETGEVTISLPYTLAEGETAANLKVYYVDDEGKKTLIESSFVDGILTFKTNHFSLYMVVYEAMSFTDVLSGDWYYDAVLYAFESEIMTGTSDTEFAPNDNMTRAMVWTVLARMSGVDTDGGDPWYSVAQDWAVENEVSDGTNPDGNITREEFATMLYRYAAPENVTQQTMLGQFSDGESVSDWAVAAMEWAVVEGIISGIEGALEPQGEATRAQMATMLTRYLTAE